LQTRTTKLIEVIFTRRFVLHPVARHTQLNRAQPIRFLDKPEELLEKEKSIILEIYFASGLTDEEWKTMAIPALLNLAKFVQLLPASTTHHHSEEGGLFRHSLETGLAALRIARNSVLSRVGTHAQVNFARTYWNNAALLGGLLHDVGKVISNFAVFNLVDYSRWEPMNESLWEWGLRTGVKEYAVISLLKNDFADSKDPYGSKESKEALFSALRTDEHEIFSRTLAPKLVPETYRVWFQEVKNEKILQLLYLSLSTHTNESGDSLRKCIRKADEISTSNYVKTHTDFPASESSLSIVTAFLSGVSYALKRKFWRVNRPGAEVFILENKCFIDWNRITLNSLAAFLETNKRDSGFIRKKEELAQWLIYNGLAHANRKYSPEGELRETPFFTIQPLCTTSATRAVWLTKSPFVGLVPSVAGAILDCTDVPPKDADDIFLTEVSADQRKAESVVSSAKKIRENEEKEIFNKNRSRTTEKFDSEKEEKVRDRNLHREQAGKIYPIRTATSIIDAVLKWFGYARFVDAEIVKESSVDSDLPVRKQSAVDKTHPANHFQQEDVIIQGVSEEFATRKIGFDHKETVETSHPEVMTSEPLFHSGDGWITYRKFPKLPRFSDSAFIEEDEDAEKKDLPPMRDAVPSFSDFKNKNTNRFLWKYYPFADKLAAFTSKENFDAVTFTEEEDSIRLQAELKAFFNEGLVPSEIFPSPEPVRGPKVDEDGVVVEGGAEKDLQVRTPEFEKDSNVIAEYVSFYRRALENFKIGRSAGCFPPEFRDAEFYPFFVELAALFLNKVMCTPVDGVSPVPLVEVNKSSVRVNGWMLLSARFRAVCKISPKSDEDDPACLLTGRVEKFLKPAVQVFKRSFQSSLDPNSKNKEEATPADFTVTFIDDLTVAAMNFLIREHKTSRYTGDEESYFHNLFVITNKGKAETAARQDRNFGREGMEQYTPPSPDQVNESTKVKSKSTESSKERTRVNNNNNADNNPFSPDTNTRATGEGNNKNEGKGEKGVGDSSTDSGLQGSTESRNEENRLENSEEQSATVSTTATTSTTSTPSSSINLSTANTPWSSSSGSSSKCEKGEVPKTSQEDSGCQGDPIEERTEQITQKFADPSAFLQVLADEILAGGGTLIVADDITFKKKKGMNMYCLSLEKFRKIITEAGLDYITVFASLATCGRKFFFQGGDSICLAEGKMKQASLW